MALAQSGPVFERLRRVGGDGKLCRPFHIGAADTDIGQHEVIELSQLAHFPVCLPIVKEPGKDRAVANSVLENRAVQDIISHDTILHDAKSTLLAVSPPESGPNDQLHAQNMRPSY